MMLALYRGNPEDGGILVGYFADVAEAQCAINEDMRNHEAGTSYYLIDDDKSND